MTGRKVAFLGVAGTLAYAGAIALAATSDHASSGLVVIAIAAGLSFTVTGVVASTRRPDNPSGTLMLLIGFLWASGALTLATSRVLFTSGTILEELAFVPLAQLLLAYPTGRLEHRRHRLLVRAVLVTVVLGPIAIGLVDPTPTSCAKCPRSAILVFDNHALAVAARVGFTVAAIALAVWALYELGRRYRAATRPLRRTVGPVYATFVVALVLLIAANVLAPVSKPASTVLGAMAIVCIALVPVAFLAGILRGRLARLSVAGLVLALEGDVPLRDALSEALGDPSVEIAYRLADRERWVDAEGRTVPAPTGGERRSVTMVETQGERVAALVHDASLDEQPELVDAVAAAAAMALQTERLQAQLRAQYEFLRAVVNTAPSLLVIVDTDGRIRNQNAAVLDAVGCDDEEKVRGRFFWDVFISDEERPAMRQRFDDAAPDFPAGEYENTFTNMRGEERVIAWRSAPVRDESGTVVSIVAGGIDITERKRQEEVLQAERDFLVTLSRATPSLLAILDPDGRVNVELGVNKAFRDLIGFGDDEATGRYFWELVAPPGREEELRSGVLGSIAGGAVREHEAVWRTRDGKELAVTWTCRRLGDAADRPLYLVCGTDVTDHRLREQQLQKERDITETLMQAIPSLVVVVDAHAVIVDSGVDETRAGVNEAFKRALGWDDCDLVHRSILDLIDEEGSYLALMAIASAANGVPSLERESSWLRSDGEHLQIAWTASPVADVTGRRASLVLISGVDVTERKRQEEEIRASRSRIVQAADEARRRLERNLHDGAQQRLVALSLSLRLAESRLASDPQAAGALLARAREELTLALEELRELARGIHPAVLTDRGLAAALEALLTRTALPVELELPDEPLPPAVEAALYYVVAEALTNVVKYAAATSVAVRVAVEGDAVVAEIVDDGIGGADPSQGTGLRGLADRVAALDGSLVVESPSTGGTRIRVQVPLPAVVVR